MRLLFATDEFRIANIHLPGFPLLVGEDGLLIEPALWFFVHHLLHCGAIQSKRSWSTYGYRLLDFFDFLERERRSWNELRSYGAPSVVASYRIDALRRGTSRATLQVGLLLVCAFYKYSFAHGMLAELPFDMDVQYVRVDRRRGLAAPSFERLVVPDVQVKVPRKCLKVLTAQEADMFLIAFRNRVHQLMALLQLSTGLRVEELVTLPLSIVKDPRGFPGVRHYFPVTLDPMLMSTKGSSARVIHIPRAMMGRLWVYASMERHGREISGSSTELFLTEQGRRYSRNAVWYIYAKVGKSCGLEVSPHVLRHTYATHTMAALAKSINLGNALLYVKNRLGHKSTKTTERYCHYIDDIADDVISAYQTELMASLGEKG